jgi:hypothetical protein
VPVTPVLVPDVPVLVPETPLPTLDDPPVALLALTPTQGATVAAVADPAEMAAPATLQFNGTICSMISTKLSGLEAPLAVVVVVVEVPPVEVEQAEEARAEPLAESPLPALAAGDALLAAPVAPIPLLGRADALLVVLVVELEPAVPLASRISMNTTRWPSVERLMKLPASTWFEELPLAPEVPVEEEDEEPADVPDVVDAEGVVNVPVHCPWVRTDW